MTIVMSAPERVGKYRITDVLGEGVSGVVYKAFDNGLQRVVAIKMLHRALPHDACAAQAFAARLREQAQTVARLAHPGIVAVHEVDEADGRAFVAMEYVGGVDLGQWLASTPLPSQAVLLRVMDQVLDALDCAHVAGVRHGDMKASNVIVTGSGIVKITDFGLARAQSRAGKAPGSAPEYQSGRPLDHRVDLYAAGLLLYRMLAGRDPFADPIASVVPDTDGLASHATSSLRAPSTVAEAHRPAAFDAVVAKAMAHDPNQRFATAADFRDALRDATQLRIPEHGDRVVTFEAPMNDALPAPIPAALAFPARAGGTLPAAPPLLTTRAAPGTVSSAPFPVRPTPTRLAPSGDAAASVPLLTIAIPDSVLSMPSYDPWAQPLHGESARPVAGERREAALASEALSKDERDAVFRSQAADRDRRQSVASAAAAANAALNAASDTAAARRAAPALRESTVVSFALGGSLAGDAFADPADAGARSPAPATAATPRLEAIFVSLPPGPARAASGDGRTPSGTAGAAPISLALPPLTNNAESAYPAASVMAAARQAAAAQRPTAFPTLESQPAESVFLSLPPSRQPVRTGGMIITPAVLAPEPAREPLASSRPDNLNTFDLSLAPLQPHGEGIPAEALRRVLRVLSSHFGAQAGDVLKQVAGRAATIGQLHTLLLEQAGEDVDTKTMAKQLKAVAKLPL